MWFPHPPPPPKKNDKKIVKFTIWSRGIFVHDLWADKVLCQIGGGGGGVQPPLFPPPPPPPWHHPWLGVFEADGPYEVIHDDVFNLQH